MSIQVRIADSPAWCWHAPARKGEAQREDGIMASAAVANALMSEADQQET